MDTVLTGPTGEMVLALINVVQLALLVLVQRSSAQCRADWEGWKNGSILPQSMQKTALDKEDCDGGK